MTEKEEKIAKEAREYVKKHKNRIVKKFADIEHFPSALHPVSVFMAGSPGAGKTEVSKRLINVFDVPVVHIDADQVREEIPQYNGKNSSVVHGAASLGVEKILDTCLKNSQPFILDGLLADYDKAQDNIDRCLKRKRLVMIFYIYQDPKVAWTFTQEREKQEGRHISKKVFVHGFVKARKVVQKLKDTYGPRITANVFEKDYNNENKKIWTDVEDIDTCGILEYGYQDIEDMV